MMSAVLFLLQFQEAERKEDKIAVERRSLLQSGVPAVQRYSAVERAEMLALLWNEVKKQML